METLTVWLLILVINGDLQEHQDHPTRKSCMEQGARFVETSLRDTEDAPLDGFFCEEQKPEEAAQVTPVCLAPTRQCS